MFDRLQFMNKLNHIWPKDKNMNCDKNTISLKWPSCLPNQTSSKVKTRRSDNWIYRPYEWIPLGYRNLRVTGYRMRDFIYICYNYTKHTINEPHAVLQTVKIKYGDVTEIFKINKHAMRKGTNMPFFDKSLAWIDKSVNRLFPSNILCTKHYEGLVQDYSYSIANALELLQSCAKTLIVMMWYVRWNMHPVLLCFISSYWYNQFTVDSCDLPAFTHILQVCSIWLLSGRWNNFKGLGENDGNLAIIKHKKGNFVHLF